MNDVSTASTFDLLPSVFRQQSTAQQAISPRPAYFQSSPRLTVFLFWAKPLPWAAPLTSDPSDTGGTEKPATRPEVLCGAAEEPTQVKGIIEVLAWCFCPWFWLMLFASWLIPTGRRWSCWTTHWRTRKGSVSVYRWVHLGFSEDFFF